MKDSELRKFGSTLVPIAELYRQSISQPAMDLWWELLRGESLADVRAAMVAHCKDPDAGRFMPTPAHILAKIGAANERQRLRSRYHRQRAITQSHPKPVSDEDLPDEIQRILGVGSDENPQIARQRRQKSPQQRSTAN